MQRWNPQKSTCSHAGCKTEIIRELGQRICAHATLEAVFYITVKALRLYTLTIFIGCLSCMSVTTMQGKLPFVNSPVRSYIYIPGISTVTMQPRNSPREDVFIRSEKHQTSLEMLIYRPSVRRF